MFVGNELRELTAQQIKPKTEFDLLKEQVAELQALVMKLSSRVDQLKGDQR